MGCLLLLLLPSASALSATPDRLTTTIRQGQVMIFHLRGEANDTLTLSTDHIGARGFATTIPLAVIKLDENGTARYAFRATGELSAVGTWEFRVANQTTFVKVRYQVDWDPVFLLEKEAANLAAQEAFWVRIETYILVVAVALILTWVSMRLWHVWSHVRPTFLGPRIAAVFGRIRGMASVTEMGLQVAEANPDFANRAAFAHTRRKRRRTDKAIIETLDRFQSLMNERKAALEAEKVYRDRVLANNPGDPLMHEFVEDPDALETAVRAVAEELWPDQEEADGAG